MTMIEKFEIELSQKQYRWLITGVAGFIGSNLLEELLKLNQIVVGIDNFSTGYQHNIDEALSSVTSEQADNFIFIQGDIRDLEMCRKCTENIDFVLQQAALGSVPRSIKDPIATNASNIDGFLNMLIASRDANVKRFVYASSSSVYGDEKTLPKKEEITGKPLSPYAVTKYVDELYASMFFMHYNLQCIGLRYFNVFGKRQDPKGAYSAVIPRWIGNIINNREITINGDGETSRDFCYIDNVIQANILAAFTKNIDAVGNVYNIAYGQKTTLNELFEMICEEIKKNKAETKIFNPIYGFFRDGDIRQSLADISKARNLLGYSPKYAIHEGMLETVEWFIRHSQN